MEGHSQNLNGARVGYGSDNGGGFVFRTRPKRLKGNDSNRKET